MLRYAYTVVCLALVLGVATAEEKKKQVTLEGKITCAKCDLGVADKCATVIVAKEDGKDVTYYFDAKGDKANHKEICQGGKDGKVTGTVSEKDGKKIITVSKVEFK
jgi:hypothetical protein